MRDLFIGSTQLLGKVSIMPSMTAVEFNLIGTYQNLAIEHIKQMCYLPGVRFIEEKIISNLISLVIEHFPGKINFR